MQRKSSLPTDNTPTRTQLAHQAARYARIATGGILCFFLSVVTLHFLRPEYNPRQRFMSEFAVGPYGSLMVLAFFGLSLGAFALALGFQTEARLSGRRWLGPFLFALCGADLLVVGSFPSDLQGAPARTLIGIIHDWASTPPFLFILLSMPLLLRHFRHEVAWQPFRSPTLVLGSAALGVRIVTLVPFGVAWSGLTQRVLVALILGWLLLATLYLRVHVQRGLAVEEEATLL